MTIATIPGTGADRRPLRDGAALRMHCRRATGRALPPVPADERSPSATCAASAAAAHHHLSEASHHG